MQVIEPSNIMAPIRSVLVACLKSSHYLFAGTADGNLVFYKIVDMNRSKKVFRSKKKGVEKLPPQYKLVHGHVVKVGKSAVSIEYGNFSGEHERRSNSGHRGNFVSSNSHDQYQKECVYVWSDRSAVLFPKGRNNFEVIALEGHNFPVEQSTRSPFSPLSYIICKYLFFLCLVFRTVYDPVRQYVFFNFLMESGWQASLGR